MKASIAQHLAAKARDAKAGLQGEALSMLEAFIDSAHLANPEHYMFAVKQDALKRALESGEADAAFGVFQSRRVRAEVRARFQDFASGWEARRQAVAKTPPHANAVVNLEMSLEQARGLRTAARYFIDCWDGVLDTDAVLASVQVALLRIRATIGTSGEECFERRHRERNGG